jgi:hypothetical protein
MAAPELNGLTDKQQRFVEMMPGLTSARSEAVSRLRSWVRIGADLAAENGEGPGVRLRKS